MKFNKRASMELSINAIVILVMAMAVLGLGLGLIRGVLGDGVNKVRAGIDQVDLAEEATADNPLANINAISLKRNTDVPVVVSFYNRGYDCSDASGMQAELSLTCQDPRAADPTTAFFEEEFPIPVNAPQGQATRVGTQVRTLKAAGSYGCTIQVTCGEVTAEQETVFIRVNS